MTCPPADDRQVFEAPASDAADFSAALSGASFLHLGAAAQLHALALKLRGQHPLAICGALRRHHRVFVEPAELDAPLNQAVVSARRWLKRPLPSRLAIVCFEKMPERFRGKATSPLWTAMGIAPDGGRSILGFWPERAGASFWLEMQRDLKRRGLRHPVIMAADRPGPLLPAIAVSFPDARLVLGPVQALSSTLGDLPQAAAQRSRRALESAALAEMPPRAAAILRQGPGGVDDAIGFAAVQSFLDLPQKLRAFLLRPQVTVAIREKLQRNAVFIPMEGEGEQRALLLAHQLRGLEQGWNVAAGRWRELHDSLAALPRSGHQRFHAQTIGHADQFHQ